MPYLIFSDFRKQIQQDNLLQIIGSDFSVLATAELQAVEEAYGYLVQKYDTAQEFTDTLAWEANKVYKAKDRIYLDAPLYSASATYTTGQLATNAGKVYRCTTAVTTPEGFTPGKWALMGDQYEIFFASLPKPEFNYMQFYEKGAEVFWKDKTYTALRDSVLLDSVARLQYSQYGNLPAPSVFPDDPVNGAAYWGAGTPYSIAAGTLPTDSTKWTNGDNRTQSVVMVVVDIALYHLHSRIAPRNVPDLRKDRYINSVEMLKAFASGAMTAKLPLLQPKSGARIRWGGQIKNTNSY